MERFLYLLQKDKIPLLFYGLLIQGFVSGFFTFRGLSLDAEGFLETAAFAVFAIATGVFIFLFWHISLKVVPHFKRVHQIIMAWFAVAMGVFFIVWASAMPNLTASAGRPAQEHHQRVHISQIEIMRDAYFQKAAQMSALQSMLAGHMGRYGDFADRELRRGEFSGSRGGSGAVHISLVALQGNMERMSRDASDFIAESEAFYDEVSQRLSEMRRIRLLDKPLTERNRLMAVESDKAYKALAQMNPVTLAKSIELRAEQLPSELVVPRNLSRDRTIARKQAEAIERLKDDIQRSSDGLVGAASTIIEEEDVVIGRFESLSPSKAARTYWQQFTPHLIAALAIDLFPLTLLIFLTAALGFKSDQERANIELENTTLGQMWLALYAQGLIKSPKIDPRGLKDFSQHMLPHYNNGDAS